MEKLLSIKPYLMPSLNFLKHLQNLWFSLKQQKNKTNPTKQQQQQIKPPPTTPFYASPHTKRIVLIRQQNLGQLSCSTQKAEFCQQKRLTRFFHKPAKNSILARKQTNKKDNALIFFVLSLDIKLSTFQNLMKKINQIISYVT